MPRRFQNTRSTYQHRGMRRFTTAPSNYSRGRMFRWKGVIMEDSRHTVYGTRYFYKDNQGELRGSFTEDQMQEWYRNGFLTSSLPISSDGGFTFHSLSEMIHRNGVHLPFHHIDINNIHLMHRREVDHLKAVVEQRDAVIQLLQDELDNLKMEQKGNDKVDVEKVEMPTTSSAVADSNDSKCERSVATTNGTAKSTIHSEQNLMRERVEGSHNKEHIAVQKLLRNKDHENEEHKRMLVDIKDKLKTANEEIRSLREERDEAMSTVIDAESRVQAAENRANAADSDRQEAKLKVIELELEMEQLTRKEKLVKALYHYVHSEWMRKYNLYTKADSFARFDLIYKLTKPNDALPPSYEDMKVLKESFKQRAIERKKSKEEKLATALSLENLDIASMTNLLISEGY